MRGHGWHYWAMQRRLKVAALAVLAVIGLAAGVAVGLHWPDRPPPVPSVGTGYQYYFGDRSYIAAGPGGTIEVYGGAAADNDFQDILNGGAFNGGATFSLTLNNGTGYGYDGWCIGDTGDNPTNAQAGLISRCGKSSKAGYGATMTNGTSGCPRGQTWFYDIYWRGYLVPAGNANGSGFSLNGRTPVCYSYELAY